MFRNARDGKTRKDRLLARGFRDILHTVGHFLRAPQEIGAILPSSPYLARRMLKAVHLENARIVVELGAGTGAITTELLNRIEAKTRLIIIDSNAEAISILRQRLPDRENLTLIHGDARELQSLLQSMQIARVDAIVSSLPYASMSEETVNQILSQSAQLLADTGHFVAFQYTPVIKRILKIHFEIHHSEIEFINFPPAIVYLCKSHNVKRNEKFIKKSA